MIQGCMTASTKRRSRSVASSTLTAKDRVHDRVVTEVTGNGLCQEEGGQGKQRHQMPPGSQHLVQGGRLLTLCVG